MSVDVVRGGFGGVKGDEATYVSMALSAAFDRDLRYERRDVDRFRRFFPAARRGFS